VMQQSDHVEDCRLRIRSTSVGGIIEKGPEHGRRGDD
jgi:hypothetical protein